MTTGIDNPRRQRRDRHELQRRDTILTAARRVIERDGIAAASMRAVAAQAGYTVAALYSYFPGKAQLFDAVLAAGLQDLDGRLRLTVDSQRGADPKSGFREIVRYFRAHPAYLALLLRPRAPGAGDKRIAGQLIACLNRLAGSGPVRLAWVDLFQQLLAVLALENAGLAATGSEPVDDLIVRRLGETA